MWLPTEGSYSVCILETVLPSAAQVNPVCCNLLLIIHSPLAQNRFGPRGPGNVLASLWRTSWGTSLELLKRLKKKQFLLPLPSTGVQGYNITSYDLKRRMVEPEITWILQKPQINHHSGWSLCKDITDPFIKPF